MTPPRGAPRGPRVRLVKQDPICFRERFDREQPERLKQEEYARQMKTALTCLTLLVVVLLTGLGYKHWM